MFSKEQIEHHLHLIRSALRFSSTNPETTERNLREIGIHYGRLGKALHYENGKVADWTCYFTNLEIDWTLSVIHPLTWKEIIPLFFLDITHDDCDKANEDKVKWVLLTLMIDNKFIASRKVCPELLTFISTRFSDRNVCSYESLSTLWNRNIDRIPSHLENLKEYADGKKEPFVSHVK